MEKKKREESHEQFDERTWQQKCRVNDEGFLYFPALAMKSCMTSTARYAGMKLPNDAKRTFAQPIIRGLQCPEPLLLPKKIDDIELIYKDVIATPGGRSKTRVTRIFPYLSEWESIVHFIVLDAILTPEILLKHLQLAGIMTGLGTWRPESGQDYGRFDVHDFETKEFQGFEGLDLAVGEE